MCTDYIPHNLFGGHIADGWFIVGFVYHLLNACRYGEWVEYSPNNICYQFHILGYHINAVCPSGLLRRGI